MAGKLHEAADVLNHTARRLLLGTAILTAACGRTTTEELIGPTVARCQIDLTNPPAAMPASGSTVSMTVSAARDCTWTAATDASWVAVSPTQGQGSGALAIAVGANALPSSRSAAVVVNDMRVTISQEAAPCRFELASSSARLDAEGGRTSVRLSTMDGCGWRASDSADWVHILTQSGTGSGTVEIDISRNGGPERSTALSIAGLSFVVIQGGSTDPESGPPSPPASSTCVFSIDPERITVPSSGGHGSVRVGTEPGCQWPASTSTPWISVQRAGGIGPGTLAYQVSANLSTVSDRSGSVAVAGRTHRVNQPACGLGIEGGVPTFLPSGGDGSFRVTTDAGCTWSASSNADWIVVTQSSGAGSNAVTFRVAPNPVERDRSGTITVSGRTKTVIQQALGQGG